MLKLFAFLRRSLLPAAGLVAIVTAAHSATFRVPEDAPTIQAAIDLASDGDVVEIAPGTYTGDGNRDISFHGKSLRVQPVGAPHSVLLRVDGEDFDYHRALVFENGEPSSAVLSGLHIKYGAHYEGGAVLISGAAGPTIENCFFEENATWIPWDDSNPGGDIAGGTLCIRDSATPVLRDCVILNSYSDGAGKSISIEGSSSVLMTGCRIESSSGGYAIYITNSARLEMESCWLVGNAGGAITLEGSSQTRLDNCVLAENGPWAALAVEDNSTVDLTQCTITANHGYSTTVAIVGGSASFTRCILYDNCDSTGDPADLLYWNGEVELLCCALNPAAIFGDVDLEAGAPHVFADPRFCGAQSCLLGGLDGPTGNYQLEAYSSCLPENNLCGEQIGALGMGCGTTSAIGACCLAGNECVITTALNCGVRGGEFKGDGTSCEGSPCGEGTPAEERSWGEIKARYR